MREVTRPFQQDLSGAWNKQRDLSYNAWNSVCVCDCPRDSSNPACQWYSESKYTNRWDSIQGRSRLLWHHLRFCHCLSGFELWWREDSWHCVGGPVRAGDNDYGNSDSHGIQYWCAVMSGFGPDQQPWSQRIQYQRDYQLDWDHITGPLSITSTEKKVLGAGLLCGSIDGWGWESRNVHPKFYTWKRENVLGVFAILWLAYGGIGVLWILFGCGLDPSCFIFQFLIDGGLYFFNVDSCFEGQGDHLGSAGNQIAAVIFLLSLAFASF